MFEDDRYQPTTDDSVINEHIGRENKELDHKDTRNNKILHLLVVEKRK